MLFLALGMSQRQQVGALPGVLWSKVLVSAATKRTETGCGTGTGAGEE